MLGSLAFAPARAERFWFPIPPARQSESAHALPQPRFIRQCGSDWEPPYCGRFGIAISTPPTGYGSFAAGEAVSPRFFELATPVSAKDGLRLPGSLFVNPPLLIDDFPKSGFSSGDLLQTPKVVA
jgi:hypothetical protein